MGKLRTFYQLFRNNILQPLRSYLSTPIAKITMANFILFASWQSDDVSSTFLARHFAFDRKNIQQYRIHTLITYSFSHLAYWHFAISIVALNVLGMKIQYNHGSKCVWALWIAGSLAGAVAMQYFMPYDSIPLPKVGADPCISAFISFLATMSPKKVAFNFLFPIRYWLILLLSVVFVLATDSSGRNLGGLAAGVGIGLLRRSLIL